MNKNQLISKKAFLTSVKSVIMLLFTIYLIICCFLIPDALYSAINKTLDLWLTKVMPPILTFYLVTSIALSIGLDQKVAWLFRPLNKFYKFQSVQSLMLFIISIFIGNPSSSSFFLTHYESDEISDHDFKTLVVSGSFITPLFIISFFNDFGLAFVIILSSVIANSIVTIFYNRKNTGVNSKIKAKQTTPFFEYLKKAPNILLLIACVMILCSIIKTSLVFLFSDSSLFSLIELATGLDMLINKSIFYSSFLVGFGCFAIHAQVSCILGSNLNYRHFLLARLFQGAVTIIFVYLYYMM